MVRKNVNKAFLERALKKAQHLTIVDNTFCQALHEYILKSTTVFWDDYRALFWVIYPNGSAEIALWLQDIASMFDPNPNSKDLPYTVINP